jgi:UDP-N-acetylglucosamine--N-acetylmuramyl-(pentapeptide) pyrophosphoryl-undecaprenol N-acetylglucosamine transferase
MFATKVAVTSEKSKALLPSHKVIETGYPVRPAFAKLDEGTAKDFFQLDPDLKTLLVCGGSQGAHSINMAIRKILPQLLDLCQVIHLSGERDEAWLEELRAKLPESQSQRYKLYGYLHDEFPHALAAADLAISRAGAAIMGEFPAVGLPSIIIPYPHAGAHQRHNAQLLVEHGAAMALADSNLDALLSTIIYLFNDEGLLLYMSENARSLARPDAAGKIATLLREIGKGKANDSQPEFSCAN